MTAFSVDEVRGRLLNEKLHAELTRQIAELDWTTETVQVEPIPYVGTTDTGTMRAVVVAS